MRYRTRTLIVIVGAAVVCASVVIANDAKTQVFFGFDVQRARRQRVKGSAHDKDLSHNIPRYDDIGQLTKASSAILVGSVVSQE